MTVQGVAHDLHLTLPARVAHVADDHRSIDDHSRILDEAAVRVVRCSRERSHLDAMVDQRSHILLVRQFSCRKVRWAVSEVVGECVGEAG